MKKKRDSHYLQVGWREWASLPSLSIEKIKVKIDTGAKTSAIHAYNIKEVIEDGELYIRYKLHPIQKNNKMIVSCISKVVEKKFVKSSNGIKEMRYVINTPIRIGQKTWDIDITLTNRDLMTYRMLLGREAMTNISVFPACSFLQKWESNS